MKTKRCSKCGKVKPISEFYPSPTNKGGFLTKCKKCVLVEQKQYREKNKNKLREYQKQYRIKNIAKIKKQSKRHYENNKDKFKKNHKEYYEKNKEKLKTEDVICKNCGKQFQITKNQLRKSKNHFCSRKCFNEYRNTGDYIKCAFCNKVFYRKGSYVTTDVRYCSTDCANKSRRSGKYISCSNCGKKIYRVKTALRKDKYHFCSHKCRGEFLRKKIELKCTYCGKSFERKYSIYLRDKRRGTDKFFCSKECHLNYQKEQLDEIKNRLNKNISSLMLKALKGNKNGYHWEDLVDYNLEELRSYLERQFIGDMTWENYGFRGWHIDHKQPVSSFNFTTYDDPEFKECWALENLQPLWWWENLSKGSKIDYKRSLCNKGI